MDPERSGGRGAESRSGTRPIGRRVRRGRAEIVLPRALPEEMRRRNGTNLSVRRYRVRKHT
jgi:hypothetical protein